MQFISNGPDIPETLLEEHESGRVVFFCGAGISYPAELPGFRGLVDTIFDKVGETRNAVEEQSYNRQLYDTTLDLLERRLPGQGLEVRRALAGSLVPNLKRKNATTTHKSLIQLSRTRDKHIRLVTTNFDRIFERVARAMRVPTNACCAPMLPIPKNSRWDAIVYLHGLLPEKPDDQALRKLVVTSGDFGLAYLTERWAARFVTELFRNYTVCFVGYSIGDPVLRYMMDALAADRRFGERAPQAYAFADHPPGGERNAAHDWEAKGTTPILYDSSNSHEALHRTLSAWAKTWRDGTQGVEKIALEYAATHPSSSTKQDDFVGRLIWAISHPSGLPARRFADYNPAPDLEWLEAFSKNLFTAPDLPRFGVASTPPTDSQLSFSLVERPAPYALTPRMALTRYDPMGSQWDLVMIELGRWLTRHLNDPKLLLWLAQRGGSLASPMSLLIEQKLADIENLEAKNSTAELDKLRTEAPNSIPSAHMRTLWRVMLSGRIKLNSSSNKVFSWTNRIKRIGTTALLRFEFRELFSPKIALKPSLRTSSSGRIDDSDQNPRQQIDWELVLGVDHPHHIFHELQAARSVELELLLGDLQTLVHDALDLQQELGAADALQDRSHWDLPSIAEHGQNRGFRDWTILIELLRDAWLKVRENDPRRATIIADSWFKISYPTFKRLALFAASHDDTIAPDQWMKWVIADNGWCLWSSSTKREVMRLLVLQSANLNGEVAGSLEAAVLAGPPRGLYHEDMSSDQWERLVERSVWLRLAKIRQGSGTLSHKALQALSDIESENPTWRLNDNQSEEFSHWMSGTGDPDFEQIRTINVAPRNRNDLKVWLRQPAPEHEFFNEDTWGETCRTRFYHCVYALCALAEENVWPTARWGAALNAWSDDNTVSRSWKYLPLLLKEMPNAEFSQIATDVAWWLKAVSKSALPDTSRFLILCERTIACSHQDQSENEEPLNKTLNHPVGHITEALLNFWFKQSPTDNGKLPLELRAIFTRICETRTANLRNGRVMLASRLIALFRVDPTWTREHLLPVFDWIRDPIEARAVWSGFLWSPRLYQPLLISMKDQFLDTAHHYDQLGDLKRQYATFLVYAALADLEGFSSNDWRRAIFALPRDGLHIAAQALYEAVESSGSQREEYWKNRGIKFWKQAWPKSNTLVSPEISESLALLCVSAGNEFPNVLNAVFGWLIPVQHSNYLVQKLSDSGNCRTHPEESLLLLNAVVSRQAWLPSKLEDCLNQIGDAAPRLRDHNAWQHLNDYVRQRSI
jgi:hypothetical protein